MTAAIPMRSVGKRPRRLEDEDQDFIEWWRWVLRVESEHQLRHQSMCPETW
jgi:hypothetical protein